MIIRPDGKVAMRWVLPKAHPRQIQVGKNLYDINSQRSVHLSWVDKSDVQPLLNHLEKTCNCGGGKGGTKRNAFTLASRLDVGVFEQGDRHYMNPDYQEIE